MTLSEPRLVAVGLKRSSSPTTLVQYATSEPLWKDQPDPRYREADLGVDFDHLRKTRLEMYEPEDIG